MPLTMTYDQWMKDTHSIIKARSESLKKVDAAMKTRNEPEVKKALVGWINEQNTKRQDWHKSVRNEKGAVKKLYDQLGILGAGPAFKNIGAEMDDALAKAHMKRDMRLASVRMFANQQLKFKDTFWGITRNKCRAEASKLFRGLNTAGNVGRSAAGVGKEAASIAITVRSISNNLETVIKAITGDLPAATSDAIIEAVFGETVAEFAASAAPAFGLFKSGAQAVQAWVGVATNIYHYMKMEEQYGNVRAGDAHAALQAIVVIIDKQIRKQTADGVIRTTAFTAKGIGVLADGGTATTAAIGAVESIAILINTLVDLAIDARQMLAGNMLLKEGKIDIELFNACPLLGCYYIAIQDHSTIMNFDIANMGRENWQQEALRLRFALDPVIEKAKELIELSRIEMPGKDAAKGVYQSTFLQKVKLKYKAL